MKMPSDAERFIVARLDRIRDTLEKIDEKLDNHIEKQSPEFASLKREVKIYTWLTGLTIAGILGLAVKSVF
jgi:hypothetical protein